MCCSFWVMEACHVWKEVIEPLFPLLVDMCKTYTRPARFGKNLRNRREECVDLLQQFITLLQFLSAVFQHSAGTVVLSQPLLVGFFLEVDISKAQRPQPCDIKTSQSPIWENVVSLHGLRQQFSKKSKCAKQQQEIKNDSVTFGSKLLQMSHS